MSPDTKRKNATALSGTRGSQFCSQRIGSERTSGDVGAHTSTPDQQIRTSTHSPAPFKRAPKVPGSRLGGPLYETESSRSWVSRVAVPLNEFEEFRTLLDCASWSIKNRCGAGATQRPNFRPDICRCFEAGPAGENTVLEMKWSPLSRRHSELRSER